MITNNKTMINPAMPPPMIVVYGIESSVASLSALEPAWEVFSVLPTKTDITACKHTEALAYASSKQSLKFWF